MTDTIASVEDRTLRVLLTRAKDAAREGRHGASVRLLIDADARAAWLYMSTAHPLRAAILATLKAQKIAERAQA